MEHKSQLIFEIEPEDVAQIPPAIAFTHDAEVDDKTLKVRLDKWLWAARFFKTRALARSAIEQGKILYDGQKVAPSKEIELGVSLLISQGKSKKIIIIKKLSTRRRGTEEANSLFEIISSNIHEAQKTCVANSNPEKKPRRIMRFLRRPIAASEFK